MPPEIVDQLFRVDSQIQASGMQPLSPDELRQLAQKLMQGGQQQQQPPQQPQQPPMLGPQQAQQSQGQPQMPQTAQPLLGGMR